MKKTLWRLGVVVITPVKCLSEKSKLKFSAGSNSARGVSKICGGENL